MPKINIHGSIRRPCPECGKDRECTCFEMNKEPMTLCSECLFDKYGIGKPKRQRNLLAKYELCKTCDKMTMRKLEKVEEKEKHLIHHFSCDICGRSKTQKIKKWRLSDKK